MTEQLVLTRTPDQILTLTFNRPEARNALSRAMQTEFLNIMRDLVADPLVRVLILTGAGEKAFCAGGDLVELANFPSIEDGKNLAATVTEALYLLETAPFPSIAAINGYALGGGSEIALACDLRIVDETARLGLVQLSLGLTPGWGAAQRLLRLVGYSRAMQLLLGAALLSPEQLQTLGLIDQIAAAGQAYPAALALAQKIAGWDQAAVQAVKRVLRNGLTLPYEDARAAEQAEFPALWAAEAHLLAVENFLNRKKP